MTRAIALAAALVIVVATGVWLTRAGRPYGSAPLTAHKLVDLGAVVFVGYLAYQAHRSTGLPTTTWALLGIAIVAITAAFASGGTVSAMAAPPAWIGRFHAVAAWASAVLTAACYYVVARA